MKLKPFELERYFAKYEFSVKYLLSSSDCDGLAAKDLLELADSETRKMWENLKLGYTESLGLPQLRQEIAKLYQGINEEDILIVAPEEGIFITMNTLLGEEDHIICTFPGYQSLYEIAESLGCEVTKWQPSEEDNWRLDPAFLESNIKSNTRLIIMNFPHNPTGSLASKEDYLRIVDIAKQNNIYLFSDEMYKFLELNPKDRLPSAVELYDKAITLFGMSKTFGMAGTRIGWVITKDKKLYSEMAAFKDYTTICSSAPSEILSLIALRAKDTIIQKHLKRINRNLGLLDDFFKKYSNLFSWVRPKAGTICFPKLLFDKSSFDFCEDVVKEAGIMVLPSTVYDYDDKHFRIGFGRENMPEALQEFESYVYKKLT
ncbi:aspartate aminotransferase [Candidatus Daviesbacteria bacterium RIFCSPHIGHO2_12_FULL_37_11]|uniref:Aminotransferase n=1 Tax=Candidatus Daviesbacteria bacterium RIFCSPHIGHO2_12_FULL_37_11 TaxID=1797777 RepID=A0A1F5KDR8_9BACT|nr:MAG: aspartate aminotransferase [Candidatus Daviesbacteria bacterium RIFCSPHIGHO2_01_FULL_37_27]OGE38915.1 MAG: aspartate aminotransferase [Candidatus Daviesbacteria bacterium RIFCSPHIGHO2_12_FULL_37_11]OGE44810.1 MAG: aspartate aminotransferase [Candidatus Daviesbacteria bacterium RIFCSPLOWO2_01_FULL_37_10]